MTFGQKLRSTRDSAIEHITEKSTVCSNLLLDARQQMDDRYVQLLNSTLSKLESLSQTCVIDVDEETSNLLTLLSELESRLSDELEINALRLSEEFQQKNLLWMQLYEQTQVAQKLLMAEYQSTSKDLAECKSLLIDHIFQLQSQSTPELNEEECQLLFSELLESEKRLSEELVFSVLHMVESWNRETSAEIKELEALKIVPEFEAQAEDELKAEVERAAKEQRLRLLHQLDAKIEALEGALRNDMEEIAEQTYSLLKSGSQDFGAELSELLSSEAQAQLRGQEQVMLAGESTLQTLMNSLLAQGDTFKKHMAAASNFEEECRKTSSRVDELEQSLVGRHEQVVKDFAEGTDSLLKKLETEIDARYDRGIKQLDVALEESESSIKRLCESVSERFRRANRDCLELLDCTGDDIDAILQSSRELCLEELNSFFSSKD